MLFAGKKIKFILHVFLEILQRYCKLLHLGTLGMRGFAHPKWYYQLVEKFRVYLQTKTHLHPPRFSGDISKTGLKIDVRHRTLSGVKFNTSGVIWSSNGRPVRHKIIVSFSNPQKKKKLFWALFPQIWAMIFPSRKGSVSFYILQLSTIMQKIRKN